MKTYGEIEVQLLLNEHSQSSSYFPPYRSKIYPTNSSSSEPHHANSERYRPLNCPKGDYYLSVALTVLLLDTGRYFSILIYTQSVGLLGQGISPSQGCYLHTEQHKHRITAHRHPCLEWDSNPRSQRSSDRRQFMP
jgi:hypothetical protein